MDETDPRIPDGLTVEQEYAFLRAFNGAISTRSTEADALAMAEASLITPEDRLPPGEIEIEQSSTPHGGSSTVLRRPMAAYGQRGGPGSGHFGHAGRPGEVGGSQPSDSGIRTNTSNFHRLFERAFTDNSYSAHVTHHSPEELDNMAALLIAEDGKAGVAIKDHGDGRIEATALFNQGGSKAAGVRLLRESIEEHGVNYLEAFGPFLPKLYGTLGFETVAQYEFDSEQAPPGWNYDRFDEPDYFVMRLPE